LLLETVIFWRFSEKFDYPNIAKHSLYAMNVLNSHYLKKFFKDVNTENVKAELFTVRSEI
jgi:hypothetical protein